MPYKRETKPPRTHEQIVRDDYLYRKSDGAVGIYRNLLTDSRDLSGIYEKFRNLFDNLTKNKEQGAVKKVTASFSCNKKCLYPLKIKGLEVLFVV